MANKGQMISGVQVAIDGDVWEICSLDGNGETTPIANGHFYGDQTLVDNPRDENDELWLLLVEAALNGVI